jgi:hypothetical protein
MHMDESLAVLIFGAVIIVAEVTVIMWRGRGWGTLSMRLIGLSLIVIGTMFLAVSKVSSDRLSAAYALLGGAFGYLVARSDKKEPNDD